jgi:hypothetical protein
MSLDMVAWPQGMFSQETLSSTDKYVIRVY